LNTKLSKPSWCSADGFQIATAFLLATFLLFGFSKLAIAESRAEYDITKSWFKPSLLVNSDSRVCNPLLNGYINSFKSHLKNPLHADLDGEKAETTSTKIIAEKLSEIPWEDHEFGEKTLRIAEFHIAGKYYAAVRRDYSIGWREGYHNEILITKPFSEYGLDAANFEAYFENHNIGTFAKSDNHNIFQPIYRGDKEWKNYQSHIYAELVNIYEKDGSVYLLFKQQNDYLLLKLLDQSKLSLTCQLSSTPQAAQIKDQISRLASVSALNTTLHEMMGTECNGGTLHALTSAENGLNEAFNVMTYRPWVPKATEGEINTGDEHTRQGIEKNLNQWGYGGIWQYSKFKNYLAHITKAEVELGNFYERNFSLSPKDAKQLAHTAISNALVTGFDHGRIKDEAHEIHQKILEGVATAKDIANIKLESDAADAGSTYGEEAAESLLTFAITQPKTLALLLDRNMNPNEPNWFGKTPLMYAAQFNQLESAKVLLAHGARTEPYTVKNSYSCIETNHLSALHYAVRYASRDFIKVLLKHGAPTSAKDSNGHTPLVYLTDHKNPNLSDADIAELKSDLLQPDENQRKVLSQKENKNAERLYREKKVQEAYASLKNALILDETNESALSNLALIALKLDKLGESAEASSKIIATTKSDDQKASAFFNLGLACREAGMRGYHYATIDFDGKSYCTDGRYTYGKKRTDTGVLSSFISSYQLKPNKDRLSAVLSLLQDEDRKNKKGICFFPENNAGVHSVYFNESYWYFLVDANKTVPFSKISGNFSNGEQPLSVKGKETIQLTDALKIERWYMEQGFQVPTHMDNLMCAPSLVRSYSDKTKLVAIVPASTMENSSPRSILLKDHPYKILTIKLTNTSPAILYFYGHNTELNFEGDLSNIHTIFIHGNSIVTLPKNNKIEIIKDGENASLNSRVDFPRAMDYYAHYATGLHFFSIVDLEQADTITLSDKVIMDGAR